MRRLTINPTDLAALSSDVLTQGSSLSFQARGSSMYPAIHDADTLTIQPIDPTKLQVGDVILYRGLDNHPIAHRIVAIQPKGSHLVITTRGDSSRGSAEQVLEHTILGKVVCLQRGAKSIPLDSAPRRITGLLWVKLQPISSTGLHLWLELVTLTAGALRRAQSFKAYRLIARRILKGKTIYRLATLEDTDHVSKIVGDNNLLEFEQPHDTGYTWTASVGKNTAGSLTFLKFSDNAVLFPGWWIFGMYVRQRYQGAGIGQQLLQLALEKTNTEGITSVNLLVFEDNRIAIRLYKKFGFRRSSLPELDHILAEEASKGICHRIIMSRSR